MVVVSGGGYQDKLYTVSRGEHADYLLMPIAVVVVVVVLGGGITVRIRYHTAWRCGPSYRTYYFEGSDMIP